MKKLIFLIFVVGCFVSAQAELNLPIVPSSPVLPKVEPNVPAPRALALPEAQSQVFEIGTHKFGGLNFFVPTNRLPIEQGIVMRNLIPEGFSALKKRDGFEKINFTAIKGTYGLGIAQGVIPQIVVACADSLRYANSTTSFEFTAVDTTEDILTYFISTPFGVVVLNGEDSARLWTNSDTIKVLGIADTVTVASVGNDTLFATDTTWTADYWIGYWVKCGRCTTHLEVLDNGTHWIYAPTLCATDSCDADSLLTIFSYPDSVGSGLGYPIGQAGAYFQDRFFISSEWQKNRIYYSADSDIDDIPPENIINLDMDAHDQIVAMRVFNGYLIVFGKYSIYGINSSLSATPITKSLGCDAPYTIALGDDYIYFKSADGVYRFNGNIYGSMSYKLEKISDLVDDIIEGIDPQNIDYCGGIYMNGQYWFSYHPDSILVFDERIQQWYGPQTFGFTSALVYSSVFGKTWNENLYPTGDGDTSQWTVSTGSDSHYYYIYHPDSLDDYLYDTDSLEEDFFEFGNTTRFPTGATVEYLTIYLVAKKYQYNSGYIYIDVVANGQRYNVDTTINLAGAWTIYQFQETTNPVTSSAWTKGDLDSLELSIGSYWGAGGGGHQVYAGALWVTIQYEGNLSASSFLFASSSKDYVYKYGGGVADDTSSDSTSNVSGKHITATYQSGFFDNDLPVDDKLLRQFYLQTESDSGDVWVYYYVDYGTTPSDSDLVHLGDKRTSWWMLGEKVKGKNFSIEIENKSNVDSLTIKGWSAILNNLGARGGK